MNRIMITGANRGIGHELARRYGSDGAQVFGLVRKTPDPLDRVEWLEGDVTDPVSLHAAARVTRDGLDLLICNAGVYLDRDMGLESDYGSEWADSFAVNVEGVFHTVQTFLPAVEASGGKIAIISSQMGSSERANGRSYVYRASKAAAVNLGRNLAVDLKDRGIPVGIYHPGWVRTSMGGANADLDEGTSAAGLMARFNALGPETTGCFENYDGARMPF